MLRILCLLAFFAVGCAHTPNNVGGRNPAAKADPNGVQTHAVVGIRELFLWTGSFPRAAIIRGSENSFNKEISDGNICLQNIKRELEAFKQDPKFQELCRRFKAANDFLSNKETACVVGVSSGSDWSNYFITPFIASPYILPHSMLSAYANNYPPELMWYEREFEETKRLENKILDPKSYAKAYENKRCHIEREPYINALMSDIGKKETIIAAKLENQAKAKNLAALAAEQSLCIENFKNLQVSFRTEFSRIQKYIPESMISAEEKAVMAQAASTLRTSVKAESCKLIYEAAEPLRQRMSDIKGINTSADAN